MLEYVKKLKRNGLRRIIYLSCRLVASKMRRFYFLMINRNLKIGKKVKLGRCRIETESNAKMTIGAYSRINDYALLYASRDSQMEIGHHCSVQNFCKITSNGPLKIGNYVLIASYTSVTPSNHIFSDRETPITTQGLDKQGITIEDDVWIGSGCRILDGVTIGRGSVIGAGAVVTKSIPPMSVAVGVPARVIRER